MAFLISPLPTSVFVVAKRNPASAEVSQHECEQMSFQFNPKIEYETVAELPSTEKSEEKSFQKISGFFGSWNVENIGAFSEISGQGSITSRRIGEIDQVNGGFFNINAVEIQSLKNWKSGKLNLTVDTLNLLEKINADICASVNSIGEINEINGNVAIWGRMQNQQPSTIKRIRSVQGALHLFDFNIDEIRGNWIHIYLKNSSVKVLLARQGILILENSSIEQLKGFSGIVVLKENSPRPNFDAKFDGVIIEK